MFCDNCGKQIADNAKFCPYCGNKMAGETKSAQAPQYQAPQSGSYEPPQGGRYQAPQGGGYQAPKKPKAPKAPKGKSHKGLIAGIIGGVAAVVVIAVVLVLVLGGSPMGKVGKAMASSVDAYGSVFSDSAMAKAAEVISGGAFTESIRFELKDVPDSSFDPNGLGISMTAGVDLKGRQAMVDLSGFYGAAKLLTADMILDGDVMSLGCPELLGADRYGVNTMKLGDSLSVYDPEFAGVGFNVFDLAMVYQDFLEEQKGLVKEGGKSFEELLKSAEIEKIGKEKMDINGERKECMHYELVLRVDPMLDCAYSISRLMTQVDTMKLAENLVNAMKLPEALKHDMLDEIQMELEYTFGDVDPDDFYDSLAYVIEELGDQKFDIYIHKDKVAALIWEDEYMENGLEVYLGGAGAYEDDLTVLLIDSGYVTEISSSGNHTGKDGVYTDTTVINDGFTELVSELYYEPKGGSNNFAWEIYEDGGTGFAAMGTLTASGKSYTLALDSVELREWDETVAEFALEVSVSEFQKLPKAKNTVMVLDMTDDELEELSMTVSDNVFYWIMDLMEQFPELEYMFY